MAGGIDLENFFEAGIMRGPGGIRYSILIGKDLGRERQEEIMIKILNGDLELRGHIYIPGEFRNEGLKSDSD